MTQLTPMLIIDNQRSNPNLLLGEEAHIDGDELSLFDVLFVGGEEDEVLF